MAVAACCGYFSAAEVFATSQIMQVSTVYGTAMRCVNITERLERYFAAGSETCSIRL